MRPAWMCCRRCSRIHVVPWVASPHDSCSGHIPKRVQAALLLPRATLPAASPVPRSTATLPVGCFCQRRPRQRAQPREAVLRLQARIQQLQAELQQREAEAQRRLWAVRQQCERLRLRQQKRRLARPADLLATGALEGCRVTGLPGSGECVFSGSGECFQGVRASGHLGFYASAPREPPRSSKCGRNGVGCCRSACSSATAADSCSMDRRCVACLCADGHALFQSANGKAGALRRRLLTSSGGGEKSGRCRLRAAELEAQLQDVRSHYARKVRELEAQLQVRGCRSMSCGPMATLHTGGWSSATGNLQIASVEVCIPASHA
jgi:hypothetical protein